MSSNKIKIEDLDKNFATYSVSNNNFKEYKIPNSNFSLFGAKYEQGYGFYKMPKNDIDKMDEPDRKKASIHWGNMCTSGVRLAFSTDSTRLKLKVKMHAFCRTPEMSILATSYFTLVEVLSTGEEVLASHLFGDCITEPLFEPTYEVSCYLKGNNVRNYVLYFPTYSCVDELTVYIDEDRMVKPYNPYKDIKPVLYYGSSITQGGSANRADNAYQAIVCKLNRIDYKTFAMSGSAKAEPGVVDYLASEDCSVFVCDYDHNAPTAEYLRATHLPLYKRFREVQPNTPIIFMSRPTAFREYEVECKEGNERTQIILDTIEYAKSQGDNNVYFIDGRSMFPLDAREFCLAGESHPNSLGFLFMGFAVKEVLDKIFEGGKR